MSIGVGVPRAISVNGMTGVLIDGMRKGQMRRWAQRSTQFGRTCVLGEQFYDLDLHTDGNDAEAAACR